MHVAARFVVIYSSPARREYFDIEFGPIVLRQVHHIVIDDTRRPANWLRWIKHVDDDDFRSYAKGGEGRRSGENRGQIFTHSADAVGIANPIPSGKTDVAAQLAISD